MTTNAISFQSTQFHIGTEVSPTTYVALGEVKAMDGPGGEAAVLDATHSRSTAKEKLMGLPDEGQIQLTVNYLSGDAGQDEFLEARAAQQLRDFKITFPGGELLLFQGYAKGHKISGQVDQIVTATLTVEITGPVTHA
jgi:hypothetical protein